MLRSPLTPMAHCPGKSTWRRTVALTPSRYAGYTGDAYALESVIGKGAFGLVTLMRSESSGQLVAMKTVDRFRLTSQVLRSAVEKEIRILEQLPPHPGVVPLVEVIENIRSIHIVLEYCNSGDLQSLVARVGPLDESCARPLAEQLAEAVAHLHDHRVAHRDLKLDNCVLNLLGSEGGVPLPRYRLRIIDFGLSTIWKEGGPPLKKLVGSLCYVAPEVLARSYYGAQADAWSLGCCIAGMLGGALPFLASDEETLRSKVCAGDYELPTRADLSPESLDLVQGLLTVRPTERLTIDAVRKHAWFRACP